MIGILKLNSKIQYGKSKNNIPYCLFIPYNHNTKKNILVASNLKKNLY